VLSNNTVQLLSLWYEDTKFESDILNKCNIKLAYINVKIHHLMADEINVLEPLEGNVEGKIENQDADIAIQDFDDNFK